MKKNLVLVLAVLVACIGLVGCGQDKDDKKTNEGNEAATKQDEQMESFAKMLGENGFLQKEVTDQMTEVKKEKSEEDSDEIVYIVTPTKEAVKEFEKADESSAWPGGVHNIQYSCNEGKLNFYHYKNYTYKLKEKTKAISKEEAAKLVEKFAKVFIENGDELKFVNREDKQYSSLYDPGAVETWTAKKGNLEYSIVVDFRDGTVVYFSCDEVK